MSFRSELKRELVDWVRDGLIHQGQADAIQARYADETTPERRRSVQQQRKN